jgi:hypothetical protein
MLAKIQTGTTLSADILIPHLCIRLLGLALTNWFGCWSNEGHVRI